MARSVIFLFALTSVAFCSGDGGIPNMKPVIASRQEWGARPPKGVISPLNENPPTYVVIHHSETRPCETHSSCIAKVKNIQDYHMDTKNWNDIGYNFLVGGDGYVYEGRGWGKSGAHSKDYNSHSIGICLIGNFTGTEPNSIQNAAAQYLIDWAAYNNKIQSDYKLLGHRQTAQTDCPGNALYQLIKTWPKWTQNP